MTYLEFFQRGAVRTLYDLPNDQLYQKLRKYTFDDGTLNDLFHRQKLSREIIIEVLKARIIRRLS